MTARSRSTLGWRDGVVDARHARLAAGQPGDRQLRDVDPRPAQLECVATRRVHLADATAQRAVDRDPDRPARMEVRIVGERRRRSALPRPEPAREQLDEALASSRSAARAGRFQAAGSAAPVNAMPSRHHSCVPLLVESRRSPCRPRRPRRPAGPGAGSSATTSRTLPSRLWRITECWLESGFVDADDPAARLALPRARPGRRAGRSARPSPATRGPG